jgi:hypothetical protein
MLEPDQWDAVLSRIAGTVYRGTERISSNALLNALQVGADPIVRQKVGKRVPTLRPGLSFSVAPHVGSASVVRGSDDLARANREQRTCAFFIRRA